jgi:phosphoglycerate kinase
MKTIFDYDFKNRKASVRVDFNVPLNEAFEITDDSRIAKAIPTLQKILNDGGSIILMSHLGRPKGEAQNKYSLIHIKERIGELLGTQVKFTSNCLGDEAQEMAKQLQPGEVLLLENLRFYNEETTGDDAFARTLASYGDIYVNDAFATAHRAHASTAIMAQYFQDKCFGTIMAGELANAERIANNPKRPMTAIVGGAKVSDKLLIIDNLLDFADNIIVGGGMAYTFMKAQGGTIGNSLCEDDRMPLTLEIIAKAKAKGVNLLLPEDSIVADNFAADANTAVANSNAIADGWMGLDIGPKAANKYKEVLSNSKTILWNGPMGVFEMPAFENGTKAVAEAVAESTSNGAFSLIGGGDSAAAVKQFNYIDKVSYVSTGGGALLEYFEGKTLPGVKAIEG